MAGRMSAAEVAKVSGVPYTKIIRWAGAGLLKGAYVVEGPGRIRVWQITLKSVLDYAATAPRAGRPKGAKAGTRRGKPAPKLVRAIVRHGKGAME